MYDLTCLKLWYAFDLTVAEGRNFADVLYRQTTFYSAMPWHLDASAPETPPQQKGVWRKFTAEMETVFHRHAPSDARPGATRPRPAAFRVFAHEAAALVSPLVVEAELRRTLTDSAEWFGCFRYDFDAPNSLINLHFKNARLPESPFADRARLAASLNELLAHIKAKGLAPQTIGCGSWINNLSPFQALFPDSYRVSLQPTSPDNKRGDGWWGQFTSRQGTLHKARAQVLRHERRFEFARLRGDCSFADFKTHILEWDRHLT